MTFCGCRIFKILFSTLESPKKKKEAITTGCFYLKGSSTSEKSSIWTIKNQALAYGWNAFMSTAVLAHQKTLKLMLFYMIDTCHASHREQYGKEGLGTRLLKAAGEKLSLCRDRRGSSKACKAVKHSSCNKQTWETLIWMKN